MIFPNKNHPAMGVAPFMETPMSIHFTSFHHSLVECHHQLGEFHHQLVELDCILMQMSSKTQARSRSACSPWTMVSWQIPVLSCPFMSFHVASIHGFIPSPSIGPGDDKANGIWRVSIEHVGIFHSNDSLHLEAWRTGQNHWFRGSVRNKLLVDFANLFFFLQCCTILCQDPSDFWAVHQGWRWCSSLLASLVIHQVVHKDIHHESCHADLLGTNDPAKQITPITLHSTPIRLLQIQLFTNKAHLLWQIRSWVGMAW